MSKAFTKEFEEEADFEDEIPLLPAGTKNYITPEGLQRLQDEFAQLQKSSVPKPSRRCPGPRAMATGRKMATIFTPSGACGRSTDECGFSAKEWKSPKPSIRAAKKSGADLFRRDGRFRNARDEEKTVRIVGIDEARSELNEVSWISPVAKALLKAGEGDIVEVRTPKGVERLQILKISY